MNSKFCSRRVVIGKLQISKDRIAALEPQAQKMTAEIVVERKKVMCEIERKGQEFRSSGFAHGWLDSGEPSIRQVVCSVNGPLLEYLGEKAMHADLGCIGMLRKSAPLYGHLEACGIVPVKECDDIGVIDDLWVHHRESNLFHKLGRAMLRPIVLQRSSRI